MAGVFAALFLVFYLGFMVDWKEFRSVWRRGGWAAVCVYAVLTLIIYSVVTTPAIVTAPGMQH
jgi:Kef-type K+ transport system membrane component KefB